MSADNRICILTDENYNYAVWEGSMSAYYYQPPINAKIFSSKKEALDYADKLAKQCVILEGGIESISNKEQILGLSYEIEDLSTRLRLLVTTGRQYESQNFN